MTSNKQEEIGILYDYQRDGHLKPGEAIVIYEDGTRRRVTASSLYKKERGEPYVRANPILERPSLIRNRIAGEVKRRTTHSRRAPAGKRLPLFTA